MILPLKIFLFSRSKKIFWNLISTLLSVLEKCLKTCKVLSFKGLETQWQNVHKILFTPNLLCDKDIQSSLIVIHPHWECISNKRRRWIFSPGLRTIVVLLNDKKTPEKSLSIFSSWTSENFECWEKRRNLIKSDRSGCWWNPALVWWPG